MNEFTLKVVRPFMLGGRMRLAGAIVTAPKSVAAELLHRGQAEVADATDVQAQAPAAKPATKAKAR